MSNGKEKVVISISVLMPLLALVTLLKTGNLLGCEVDYTYKCEDTGLSICHANDAGTDCADWVACSFVAENFPGCEDLDGPGQGYTTCKDDGPATCQTEIACTWKGTFCDADLTNTNDVQEEMYEADPDSTPCAIE